MQGQTKKKNKKPPVVYKPYKKGLWHSGYAAKKGLRLLAYYLIFLFLYLVAGTMLQFENVPLRIAANALLVLVCCILTYMNGAKAGEEETALGEIAWMREQEGKQIPHKDLVRCFHPLKGAFVFAAAVLPLLLLTLIHALNAKEQAYVLQSLPGWVDSFSGQSEISQPLSFYGREAAVGALDYLRIAVRLMVYPFANMAADSSAALLLVDRLSPLLVCVPALGYPIGYLTGPFSRARVHGDIAANVKKAKRREKKAQQARRAQMQKKKNEII